MINAKEVLPILYISSVIRVACPLYIYIFINLYFYSNLDSYRNTTHSILINNYQLLVVTGKLL